jgi:hypothetical protein
MENADIACRIHALDAAQRERQRELLALMRTSAQDRVDLPDGYALRLPTDARLVTQAAEWIGLERRCCPFVRFELDWGTDDRVWVRFTGGPGVKTFLAHEILGS